ncbi:hypothetical protein KP509_18G073900 [Ceratopteris richardii]|uniref:Cyanovirin-N domain-containing protein n=1 Tax=Ceratopteris richardii TaxID=49495 RepID=A0A8T2SSV5_CERRI|nr:hypothetical protein KP509_18G073900 [Ceratopteris richardii]
MASISKAAFLILIISMVNLSTHANTECLFVGGNFSHSCRNIRLLPDRTHLEATCGTPPNTSQLYLNEKVANDNGVLRCKQCFGFMHLIEKKCEFSQSAVIFNFTELCSLRHVSIITIKLCDHQSIWMTGFAR